MKYIVVTGGSLSGLGKGTAVSSIGVVLRTYGIRVTAIKVDPYLNIDAGKLNPFEHGEVFVLEDGGEVDLDLGNYERFLDVTLTSGHWVNSGKILEQVIKRERMGHYLGKKVQMIPHVSDGVQDWIADVAERPVDRSGQRPDVCLIELGGTVGDIETGIFLEALQQLMMRVGPDNFCVAHVCMVPVMGPSGEQKTKPCQQSVRQLREAGLRPDLLLCRVEQALEDSTKRKLSVFCQVPLEGIMSMHDMSNIYRVPLLLADQDIGGVICGRLGLLPQEAVVEPALNFSEAVWISLPAEVRETRLGDWRFLADRVDMCTDELIIAIVGRYTGLHDSYLSVVKALRHAAVEVGLHLCVEWVDSGDLEPNAQQLDSRRYDSAWRRLQGAQGVLVPGGFGDHAFEGKVRAAQYARTSSTPFLGIASGFQCAVVEFARSELGLEAANSTEFDEATQHPVVIFMPEASASVLGGTMRLGSRQVVISVEDCMAHRTYGKTSIQERHRHRYEVNPQYVSAFESRGLTFSGKDEKGVRMEICELKGHPFYMATQFHPELQTRPSVPSPPLLAFVLAASHRLDRRVTEDGGTLRPGAGFEKRV